ncbi:acyl-CoA dehydrogenase [Gluconacetobacter azotocaptans DSM 13594]|nr:acyl-CoA dehydrogenase [Gluconacetobacter azotocaptans DSM 13594]
MDGMHPRLPYTPDLLRTLTARFAARAATYDRSGEIATGNLDDLRQAGLLALTVPSRYGGHALGLRQVAEVVGTIAQGDPSTALILSMQYLQHAAIVQSGRWPENVHRLVSTAAVRDGALLNALRVEPELGTPARGGMPATVLHHDGTTWRLNGSKIYSTGSTALRWGIAWVSTREDTPRTGQALVPLDAPGVRIERTWRQMGMRATGSHTIVFDNVALPDDHLVDLRPPQDWARRDSGAESTHALVIGALYDGVARSARNWLISFLHARVPANLGQPLATLPRFHSLLGEIDGLLMTNRALLADALDRHDRETLSALDANLVKHLTTENAIRAVEQAVAAIGNPALSQDNPLERHYRDVLCARIHTPQADVALAAAGRAALTPPPE